MANIVAPVQRPPQGRKCWWGREDVAVGTPPTGQTGHPIVVEPITNFDVNDQRDIYDAVEYTGAMTDSIGKDELTHYVQGTLTSPFRAHGITAQLMACMMGNQLYTPSGAGPYVHSLAQAPLTNRTNTLSAWWQTTVDANNTANYIKQFVGISCTSLTLTFGAGSALNAEAAVWTRWPTYQPPPVGYAAASTVQTGSTATSVIVATGTSSQFQAGAVTITGMTGSPIITAVNTTTDTLTVSGGTGTPTVGGAVTQNIAGTGLIYVGNDPVYTITRTMGWQGSFTFLGSTGAQYTPRILSGTLVFTRPAEAVFAADSQTIVDVALGPLTISGTAVFQFDGYAPGTVARDYSDFKPTGTNANPNMIKFTDNDGNYFQIQSYPWKWHPFTLDYSGQFVKGNGSFTAYNDPTQVMQASPILTAAKNLSLRNNISTAMIGP